MGRRLSGEWVRATWGQGEGGGENRDTPRGDLSELAPRRIGIRKREEMEAGNTERYEKWHAAARYNHPPQHCNRFGNR